MVWLIGALVGIVCFSIIDHFKVPTLLQWVIVFFILMMFLFYINFILMMFL